MNGVCVLSDKPDTVSVENATDKPASAESKTDDAFIHKPRSVESKKRYTCSNCEFATNRRGQYNQHIARRCCGTLKQRDAATELGETEPVSVDGVKRHSKKSADDNTIPCPCCQQQFDTAAKLDGHLRDDHSVNDEITSCRFCSFRFVHTMHLNFTANFK